LQQHEFQDALDGIVPVSVRCQWNQLTPFVVFLLCRALCFEQQGLSRSVSDGHRVEPVLDEKNEPDESWCIAGGGKQDLVSPEKGLSLLFPLSLHL
jgi:hypothetical protein